MCNLYLPDTCSLRGSSFHLMSKWGRKAITKSLHLRSPASMFCSPSHQLLMSQTGKHLLIRSPVSLVVRITDPRDNWRTVLLSHTQRVHTFFSVFPKIIFQFLLCLFAPVNDWCLKKENETRDLQLSPLCFKPVKTLSAVVCTLLTVFAKTFTEGCKRRLATQHHQHT